MKKAPHNYRGRPRKAPQTNLDQWLITLKISDPVALFEGKASRSTIANWRAGRHLMPPWAVEIIAQKMQAYLDRIERLVTELKNMPERPGRKAGAINLARWKAHRYDTPKT